MWLIFDQFCRCQILGEKECRMEFKKILICFIKITISNELLDKTDRKTLNILKKDNQITNQALADKAGISALLVLGG